MRILYHSQSSQCHDLVHLEIQSATIPYDGAIWNPYYGSSKKWFQASPDAGCLVWINGNFILRATNNRIDHNIVDDDEDDGHNDDSDDYDADDVCKLSLWHGALVLLGARRLTFFS